MYELESLLNRLNDLIGELGIPARKSHRFTQILEEDNKSISFADSLNIFKDLSDLSIILDSASRLNQTFLKNSIERMIDGSLYKKNGEDPTARNFQAELTAAALFINSGLIVDLGGANPDLLIYTPDCLYGVEVKRITSFKSNKARERAREAATQLRERFLINSEGDRTGLIYLSVESHLKNDAHTWKVADLDIVRTKVIHEMNTFKGRHSSFHQDREVFKDKRIAAIIVNYEQPYFDVTLNQYRIYNRYEVIPNNAYWQSMEYIFPQFMRDIYHRLNIKTKQDRDQTLKRDTHNLDNSALLVSYIDASYVLSCESLPTFNTEEDASQFIKEHLQNASTAYECYQCEKWHTRGSDTIRFNAENFDKLKNIK